jgi:hypothetical protein
MVDGNCMYDAREKEKCGFMSQKDSVDVEEFCVWCTA